MIKKAIFMSFALATGSALFTACGNLATTAANDNSQPLNVETSPDNNSPGTDPAFKFEFRSEPGQVQAGTPASLIFTVKDKQGSVVKDCRSSTKSRFTY